MKYSRIYQFTSTNQELTLTSATAESNDDDIHLGLFDHLRSVFLTHTRRQFGHFDQDTTDTKFRTAIAAYHQQNIDAANLSQQVAEHFKSCLETQEQPGSGYLWCVIDSATDDDYLYFFLLKQDETHQISRQLTVKLGNNITPSRLQYAVKVNVKEWQEQQSQTYLTFLSSKNQLPITNAWNTLVGFTAGINRTEQTEEFLNVVEQFAEALPAEQERDYRTRVIDYCLDKERAGEPVEIQALSKHINESEPEAFLNFVTEHVDEPPPVLHPDRTKLKRHTRISGRAQDLSISFSTMLFGSDITYDENSDTLTIRALPTSLKSQIKQYLKK